MHAELQLQAKKPSGRGYPTRHNATSRLVVSTVTIPRRHTRVPVHSAANDSNMSVFKPKLCRTFQFRVYAQIKARSSYKSSPCRKKLENIPLLQSFLQPHQDHRPWRAANIRREWNDRYFIAPTPSGPEAEVDIPHLLCAAPQLLEPSQRFWYKT